MNRPRSDFAAFDAPLGLDDPDRLVAVPAGELDEWAWMLGRLGEWLRQAGQPTAAEFAHHFRGHPTREGAVWMLDAIVERIGGLLDGALPGDDGGQP